MKATTYIRSITALLVITASFAAHDAKAEGDAEQGAQLAYSCLGCHGIEGYRNAYPSYRVPKLGGQKRSYIESALQAYRDGTRAHPTMQAQGGSLSDKDIADLGAWFDSVGPAVTDATTSESVSHIAVAATCVACHGEAGVGVVPQPPTLSGQQLDYIVHALQQYKSGKRSGTVMSAFAGSLSDEDMLAVATYYSSQSGLFTPKSDQSD